VLNRLQIPLAAGQIVIICGLSCMATFGAYRLVRATIELEQIRVSVAARELVSVGAAVLWTVSPFALAQVWYRQTFLEVTWALLPWLVLLAVRAATDSHGSVLMYYVYGCGLALIGSAGLPEAYLPGIAILTCVWLCPVVGHSLREKRADRLGKLAAAGGGVLTGVS
jgi:hypothetical protein